MRTEGILDRPVVPASLANHPDVGRPVRLSGFFQLQCGRALGTRSAPVDIRLPREVIKVARRASYQEPGRYCRRSSAMTLVVKVSGPIGSVHGYFQLKTFPIYWREQVTTRAPEPSRKWVDWHPNAGPFIERAGGLLFPRWSSELAYVTAPRDGPHRSD